MNLQDVRNILEKIQAAATSAKRLRLDVGQNVLGVKRNGRVLTIWTESANMEYDGEQVVIRKRAKI